MVKVYEVSIKEMRYAVRE